MLFLERLFDLYKYLTKRLTSTKIKKNSIYLFKVLDPLTYPRFNPKFGAESFIQRGMKYNNNQIRTRRKK